MAEIRRARTPDPVRDRTADPPVGRTYDPGGGPSQPVAGFERETQVDDRGAGYDRPRHAREGDRGMGSRAAPEHGPTGGMPRPGAWAASAPSAIALLGGVWLVVSRLVFDFATAGSTADGVVNGVIVGIAVTLVALALMSNASANPALGFVLAVLGAWMIAAPWVFNYGRWGAESEPTFSDVITGAAIALTGLATWLAGMARQIGAARRTGMAM
jgi:hypothetical protein